jgi:type II secretory pathway predicted ATPase ExeA
MYCEFYQLTERPFNVTPDPKFLYLNARYREAIASLNYGITQRKGFITLIGEAGTGKTTLLKRLLEDLDPKTKTVFIFNTNVTFEEILEYIFAEFDLPVHNGKKLYMLQRLNTFLLEELRSGGNVALLIDEAQDLEFSVLEDLRLLSNLETAKEKILQIVLSGQPELGQKLSNPVLRQLRQRISINCRLLPLSRDEITEYLQYRLQAAGGPDLKLFTREAEDQIYHFSRGVPRLVNVVCDNALVIGYALGKKRIGADIIKEAAADLLPVELHEPEGKPQTAANAAVAAATPQQESRSRARMGIFAAVLIAVVVVGLLSLVRTRSDSASADRVAAARARQLEVIEPGSETADVGIVERHAAVVPDKPVDPPPRIAAEETPAAPAADELKIRDPREEARRRQLASARNVPLVDARANVPEARAPIGLIENPVRVVEDEPPGPEKERAVAAVPAAVREAGQPTEHEGASAAAESLEPESRTRESERAEVAALDEDLLDPELEAAGDGGLGEGDLVEEDDWDADMVDEALPKPVYVARAEPQPAPVPKEPAAPELELVVEEAAEVAAVEATDPGSLVVDVNQPAVSGDSSPRLDGVRFARIRVQEGDSISGIALRRYGQANATILDLLKLANPNLSDIDVIVVGQTIRLPELDQAFPILNEGEGRYSLLVFSTAEGWRANALRDELRSRGFSAGVSRSTLGASKGVHRVVVAGFASRDEVVEAGRKLQRLFREDARIAELGRVAG